jgi:hypothetical protein
MSDLEEVRRYVIRWIFALRASRATSAPVWVEGLAALSGACAMIDGDGAFCGKIWTAASEACGAWSMEESGSLHGAMLFLL